MRHVWLLNHYASEPSGPGGGRHFALASHLPEFDWTMHLIAASVQHKTLTQRLNSGEAFRSEQHDGVNFVWLKTPRYTGNDARRVLNMLTYSVRALDKRMHRALPPPDAIIGSSVHPFAALAGAMLARRFDVPFLFEVRDLWPLTLIVRGKLREHGLAARAMRAMEKFLYRRSARVISLLPRAHEYITGFGIPKNKIMWLPNGVNLAEFPRPPPPRADDVFEIVYLGAHTPSYDLDLLLRAFALFTSRHSGREVRLRLVGDGPSKPELVRLAQQLQLKTVCFDDPVPKREVPRICARANAFVVLVSDLPGLYRYGLSFNKIYDYLAAARPTVIAISTGNNPIAEAGAGITVPAGDVPSLAEAFEQLLSMSDAQRVEMGNAGRGYVERHHDSSLLARRLAETLDDVTEEHSGGKG